MNHEDHVELIRRGIPGPGGTWADLGSGRGAFTLALAELIGPQGHIYSLDKDGAALREQARAMQTRFPTTQIEYLQADFSETLSLPPLDGIVMANSLHFLRQKEPLLRRLHGHLRPGGRLILVEYNVDRGNLWVPYPLSYTTWEALARDSGFRETRLLARRRSRHLGEIYSALSLQ